MLMMCNWHNSNFERFSMELKCVESVNLSNPIACWTFHIDYVRYSRLWVIFGETLIYIFEKVELKKKLLLDKLWLFLDSLNERCVHSVCEQKYLKYRIQFSRNKRNRRKIVYISSEYSTIKIGLCLLEERSLHIIAFADITKVSIFEQKIRSSCNFQLNYTQSSIIWNWIHRNEARKVLSIVKTIYCLWKKLPLHQKSKQS